MPPELSGGFDGAGRQVEDVVGLQDGVGSLPHDAA